MTTMTTMRKTLLALCLSTLGLSTAHAQPMPGGPNQPDMTLDEGIEVMNSVIAQIKQRFVYNQRTFIIKVLSKDGVQISYHKN